MLGFSDPRVIAPLINAILLVFKYDATAREAARLTRQVFMQINCRPVGVILNDVKTYGPRYGKYYSYYDYKYYKGYYDK